MNLLHTSDVTDRLYASPDKTRRSLRPVRKAGTANSSEIKSDGPWAAKLTFVEDYILEHSLPGSHTASIEISGCF